MHGLTWHSTRMHGGRVLMLAGLILLVAACARGTVTPAAKGEATMTFTLESTAFTEGGQIPTRFTCDGANASPPLRWEGAPDGTQSFALIVDDPDAPRGTFTHWVLFDLPASQSSLPEGFRPGDAGTSGTNSFGQVGYGGPCPPRGHGPHRYFFTLYALDRPMLGLARGASRDAVAQAIAGHTLAQAHLMGRYERQ